MVNIEKVENFKHTLLSKEHNKKGKRATATTKYNREWFAQKYSKRSEFYLSI